MEKGCQDDMLVESEKIAAEVTPPADVLAREELTSEDIEAHIVNASPAPSPLLATPEPSSKVPGKSFETDNSPGEDEGAKDEIRSILEQFDPLSLSDQQSEEHLEPERPKPTRKPSREPEPPFDFNRFLEQMRQKSADPIAKYLKSFLREFGKKRWTTNEQIKIVTDFLEFITSKMQEFEPWKNCSDAEFENAKEGMEKLVMNRLYNFTFTPAIQGSVTTDDRERDEVLKQKIEIFRWVKEEHLDIPNASHNASFLAFAQQELLKINHYKAPRDKLICILNCCKVIFGLIRHVDGEESADKFIPILIFVVLKANPEHLISNVQYINRFRSAEKLQSEAGYYLSSLMGAISFIENMDFSSLSIDKADFEKNVETSVAELAKERAANDAEMDSDEKINSILSGDGASSSTATPRGSPMLTPSRNFFTKGGTSLQRTLQRPLSVVGRIFSDSGEVTPERSQEERRSPPPLPRRQPGDRLAGSESDPEQEEGEDVQFEVERINAVQYQQSLDTLKAMFPNVEYEVVLVVFQACEGQLATAIDNLLEMSGQGPDNPAPEHPADHAAEHPVEHPAEHSPPQQPNATPATPATEAEFNQGGYARAESPGIRIVDNTGSVPKPFELDSPFPRESES